MKLLYGYLQHEGIADFLFNTDSIGRKIKPAYRSIFIFGFFLNINLEQDFVFCINRSMKIFQLTITLYFNYGMHVEVNPDKMKSPIKFYPHVPAFKGVGRQVKIFLIQRQFAPALTLRYLNYVKFEF